MTAKSKKLSEISEETSVLYTSSVHLKINIQLIVLINYLGFSETYFSNDVDGILITNMIVTK